MTTTVIAMPAEHSAWLALRDGYWNASDTAALFAEHPFVTLADVAVRKLTGKRQAETAAMARGHRFEQPVAEWWSEQHGVAIAQADRMFLYDDLVLATPDYLIVGVDDECVEVKVTTHTVIEPLRYWWWQVQAQCLAGDLARVHLAVFDRHQELQSFVIERDEEACALIVERAGVFMNAVRAGDMPDDVDLTYDHQLALHPTSTDDTVELDDAAVALVRRLDTARAFARQVDAEEERVRAALAAILGDAGTGTVNGVPVVTWRSQQRRGLDAAALRRQHPDVAEQFSTTTSYRVMRTTSR